MEDRIFIDKCRMRTSHRYIHEAIEKFQNGTSVQVSSTKNVKVLNIEIIKMNTKSS